MKTLFSTLKFMGLILFNPNKAIKDYYDDKFFINVRGEINEKEK